MFQHNPYAMLFGRGAQVGRVGVEFQQPPNIYTNPNPGLFGPGPGLMLPGPSPMVPVYPGCGPQIYGAPQAAEIVATNPLPVNSRDIGDGQPIGANGTQKALPTSPTVTMCIKQYIVARTSGPFFDVLSIKAARVEYNGDGGGVPAECYSPDSTMRMPQQFPWLNPGTQIIVLVRNNDGEAQHFGSTFIGVSYPGCAPCS